MGYTRRLNVQNISYEVLDETSTATVNAAANEIITVTAPAGYIYEVIFMMVSTAPPAASASGSHMFEGYVAGDTSAALFKIQSNFNVAITWKYNIFVTCTTPQPDTDLVMVESVKQLRADDTTGFQIKYSNNTDVNQTNGRNLFFLVKKIKVV